MALYVLSQLLLYVRQARTVLFRAIPFAKRVSRSLKMKDVHDVGSLLLVLKLDDDFDGDINDIV